MQGGWVWSLFGELRSYMGKKKLIRINLQNPRDIFTPFLYSRIVWDFRGHFAQSLHFPGEEIVAIFGKSRIRFPDCVMTMRSVLLAQRIPVLHTVMCPHPFWGHHLSQFSSPPAWITVTMTLTNVWYFASGIHGMPSLLIPIPHTQLILQGHSKATSSKSRCWSDMFFPPTATFSTTPQPLMAGEAVGRLHLTLLVYIM